ncbi:hypothetical protein [Paractinoplanes rishiriensis]|uniref:Uncharacterized protein n=1 Tax=Paractinoplanes rishiriensis TaxID=1050105 RepID=A0A919MTY2_9ACTN|nr:hypothetical protein [Actinoplanes rishiriensis]GIE99741.1 hypothetical protein Ari01nite_72060 [Actinoplanes rishiriensis]
MFGVATPTGSGAAAWIALLATMWTQLRHAAGSNRRRTVVAVVAVLALLGGAVAGFELFEPVDLDD